MLKYILKIKVKSLFQQYTHTLYLTHIFNYK